MRATRQSDDPTYAFRKAKASLFFDDDAMLEFLAAERFPNDSLGALRYSIEDGEIFYEDPETGEKKKEFVRPQDASLFDEYLYPNIAPVATFGFDVAGSMAGATKGFQKSAEIVKNLGIKNPYLAGALTLGGTALGGGAGAFGAGLVPRAGRVAAANYFYNTPPEELAAAARDLGISTAFSLYPFGAGPTAQVVSKFGGREKALRNLFELKTDVQGVIDEARKLGIDLSVAEAAIVKNGTAKRAADIQFFLSKQPQIQKVHDFYQNRAARAREAVISFADSMANVGKQFGSPQERVTQAANSAIKMLSERRQVRASKIYDALREEGVQVDLNPFIAELSSVINDPKTGANVRKVHEDFRSALFEQKRNPKGKFVEDYDAPLTDLMVLSDRRNDELAKLVKNAKDDNLERIAAALRDSLTDELDRANEAYAFARRVYDPSKPAAEAIERSAIGRMSGLFEKGADDKRVARALKDIFDPNLSPRSMRNVRRVLETVDPGGWQEVKKFYINDRLAQATTQNLEGGMPSFQRVFAAPKERTLLGEMFSPEEFDSFYRINDLLGTAFNAVKRGGSDTQPLLTLEKELSSDAAPLKGKALNLALSIVRLPGRILQGTIGDDLVAGISRRQQEAYLNTLADVMFDPDGMKTLDEVFNYFNTTEYGVKQAATRGAAEAIGTMTEDRERFYEPTQRMDEQEMQRDRSSLNMIDPFSPLPSTMISPPTGVTPPTLSPTLLPDEEDRLIAARQAGIGGLLA
jgi:hypothetical protein